MIHFNKLPVRWIVWQNCANEAEAHSLTRRWTLSVHRGFGWHEREWQECSELR